MESQVFDYIVVGAGSAGSVLANRLSADPKHRVLVLEAGRESHPWSRIPVGFARLIQNPAANWLYSSEPDDGTGHAELMQNGPCHEVTELVITGCPVNMLIRVINLLELRQEYHAEIGREDHSDKP